MKRSPIITALALIGWVSASIFAVSSASAGNLDALPEARAARPLFVPPVVSSHTPATATAGVTFGVFITGTDFTADTVVTLADTPLTITSRSAITLAALTPAPFTTAGPLSLVVSTPGPGGGTAAARTLTIEPAAAQSIIVQQSAAAVPANATAYFTSTVQDAYGNVVSNGQVTWQASAPGIVAGGTTTRSTTFNSTQANTVLVTATLGSATGSTLLTVDPGPVSTLTVTPNPGAVNSGSLIAMTAQARDAFNNLVTVGSVTWQASSGSIVAGGTSTRTTTFTGGAAGTAWITATLSAVSGSATVAVSPGPAATISIAPATATLTSGTNQAYVATVRDAASNIVTAGSVVWNASSGTISAGGSGGRTGTFTGGAAGTAWITATLNTISGTATATVNPGAPASIALNISPATMSAGNTAFITATVRDAANNIVTTGSVTWAASRSGIIAGGTGTRTTTFNGTQAGTTWITATLSSASGSTTLVINPAAASSITVTPNPGTVTAGSALPFTAVVRDAFNNVVTSGTVAWSASSGAISAGGSGGRTGNFTGSLAGTAWVTATLNLVSGSATATVNPGPPARVTLDPNSVTLAPLGSIGFTAQLRDQFDNPIGGASYTWSAAVGSVTPAGPGAATATYQAGTTAGEYVNAVSASASGFTGNATVVVNPSTPATIVISPGAATLQPRGQQTFYARGYDQFNNLIWPLAVNWSTSGTGVITPTGIATATFEAGTLAGAFPAAVRAGTSGVTGTADVNVTAGPLAAVTIIPDVIALPVNSTQALTASGRDAYGNPVNTTYTWSIVPPTAGTFDSTAPASAALRTGTVPGVYNQAVRAQSGAIIGTADVVVQVGTATAVNVTPPNTTLPIGGLQLFSASVVDAFGNPVPGPGVLWQTSIGTVQSSGPYTALVKIGTQAGAFPTGVRAFFGPITGNAAVTVPADPASALSIGASPSVITTNGADAATITVQVTDQYGNPVGAGMPVALAVTECTGACELGTSNATTDAAGRVVTTLRSDYRSATTPLTSKIKVTASMNGASGPVNQVVEVTGTFTPYRQLLTLLPRVWPVNNHTACTALPVVPPDSVTQPADRTFSIYRIDAAAPSYTVVLRNFAPPGQLLLYRIVADNCAINGTMTVSFVPSPVPVTSSTFFQTTLANKFIPGASYLLAVNVTGAGSNQLYQITIQP